jgi:hypothetical protein
MIELHGKPQPPPPLEDDRGSRYNEVEQWAHTHEDSRGILHRCWHVCTHAPQNLFTNWKFWAGMTFGFPIEHYLWEKVPVFRDISAFLGL